MRKPEPLANPRLRSRYRATALLGVVATGCSALAALIIGEAAGWVWVVAVATGWVMALKGYLVAYSIGWNARIVDEYDRTAGHWIAYPVDDDGIPTTAPREGRLIVDQLDDS